MCYDIIMKILLKEIRKKRGLSLRQVSILTGVGYKTIHDIENGSMPRIDTLELLAKGLKIKISDLISSDYL